MRHAGAPAGAATGQGRADTRAGAGAGADGAQERQYACGHRGRHGRRDLCRTCYRKFRDCGVDLPPTEPHPRHTPQSRHALLKQLLGTITAALADEPTEP